MSSAASWVPLAALEHRIDPSYYTPDALERARWLLDWQGRTAKVGTITSLVTDGTHATPQYVKSGVPFLSATNIDCCSINLAKGHKYVTPEAHGMLKRANCSPADGDVLVSKSGRIGTAATNHLPFEYSVFESVAIVRLNEHIDPDFLAVFLNTEPGVSQIERFQKGAVQKHLHLEELREVRTPLVEPALQRAIGNKVRKAERLREHATKTRELAAARIQELYGNLPSESGFLQFGWMSSPTIATTRLDAWFYRPFYIALESRLRGARGLRRVGSICKLVASSAKLSSWGQHLFDYFEIGGINGTTGEAIATTIPTIEAPSRAKYVVRAGDILVSTVRPNLRAVGQVDPDRPDAGVATSGFSVLRPSSSELGAYVRACLQHDAAVSQMMRWNSGGTYPVIDRDVPGEVLIPFDSDEATEVGAALLRALRNDKKASYLVKQATDEVESLLDGGLVRDVALAEGASIEEWLRDHPSPYAGGRR